MALSALQGVVERFFVFVDENQNVIVTTSITGLGIWLFRRWKSGGRCRSTVDLHGKTVIITGANTGIGKETARDLVRRGARVILACRNLDTAVIAANDIQKDATGEIVVRKLDLASFASIRTFAKQISDSESHVDILINSARVYGPKLKTEDGFDRTFGINHLGHFLLTNLLLDRLKKSAPARIINVSSSVHKYGTGMYWEDLNLDRPKAYVPWKAYCQSKLANILFSKELGKRLLGTGVTTYAVHPGFVRAELDHYHPEVIGWTKRNFYKLLGFMMAKTPAQGAQTTIYCAVADELQNKTGYYYRDCHESTPSPKAMDWSSAARLWEVSLKMVGLDNNNEKGSKT